jgi:ribosomal protein S8
MSNPITIQLPPNLEQQMRQEAQRQNITLETLIIQSIQKDYDRGQDSHAVANLFAILREAWQTGQASVQVPANPDTLEIAASLKRTGILLDFQPADQHLILQINPTPPPLNLPINGIDSTNLEPEVARMIAALQHENENVRFQALQDLTQWYEGHEKQTV